MSITLFLSIITAINISIFSFLKPLGDDFFSSTDLKEEQIPQIIFKEFALFDIGNSNLVETTLSGNYGEGFRDGKYRIRGVELKYQNSQYLEQIKSKYAFFDDGNIEIVGDVQYSRSDDSLVTTEKASYDIDNKYFYIPDSFIFKRGKTTIKGTTLIIKRDLGTISAFNINAVLKNK
jgi:hypothetical protein